MGVFSMDIPCILLYHNIDFAIYREQGIKPILIPSYRMAPIVLKELNEYLQDLLNKGFIRFIASPLGAFVLFVKNKDGFMLMYIDYR